MSRDKLHDYLLEWAVHFFKSRDAFYKKIISIEKNNDFINIVYKDHTETIHAFSSLDKATQTQFSERSIIITVNSKQNVSTLYSNWDFFSKSPLKIYFINPLSTTEKKWVINPHLHNKIAEKEALLQGLDAMSSAVEETTSDQLAKGV